MTNQAKINATLLFVLVMTGCSTSPPPPPAVKGEYRPVNQVIPTVASKDIPRVFDFKFKGTAYEALAALQTKQHQFVVLPTQGREVPTKVEIDLRQVSLESAIKIIGIQGAGIYEVVYKNDPLNNTDSAYIKFLRP
jgi:hypothetical protein